MVQALFREGSLAEARDALDEEAAWDGASAELLVWRACRLAESLSKLRDFARAEQVIISAESLVANHRVAASFLGDSVKLLRLRLAYQVNPMNSPFVVLGQLQPVLAGCAQIDRLAVGLAYNLAALCHRRWFESASSQPFSAAGLQHREDALAHGFAAVFCFATAELPNYAEYACANLGYLLSRLYSLRVEDSLVAALEWYGIAQAWHNRYELVDDSVWEYIFLGDLMLYQPHAPQAFKQLTKSVKWDGTPPDTLEFFDLALRRAREIGDPRQLAHSALNLMWFARKNDLRGAADAAAAELLAVFSLHPDLRKLLSEEGYPLPAQNPLRKDKPVHGQQDVHDA